MPDIRQSIPAMIVLSCTRPSDHSATAGCQAVVISLRNIPEHLLRRAGPDIADRTNGQGSFPARRMRQGAGSGSASTARDLERGIVRWCSVEKPKIVPFALR